MTSSDAVTFAAVLLIVGPLLGAVPVANPALVRVWAMSRDEHIRTVGAHRRAWAMLNIGFGFATLLTSTGLLILGLAAEPQTTRAGGLALVFVTYALGGGLWLAMLAIRSLVTPTLSDLVAGGTDPGPAEALVGALNTGLFQGFVVATCAALVVLGATYLLAGGMVAWLAGLIAVAGILGIVWLLVAGDVIPAALYVPTLLLGIALLAGWS